MFLHRFEAAIPLAGEAGELMPDLRPFCATMLNRALSP
jgi:hypothetical protein